MSREGDVRGRLVAARGGPRLARDRAIKLTRPPLPLPYPLPACALARPPRVDSAASRLGLDDDGGTFAHLALDDDGGTFDLLGRLLEREGQDNAVEAAVEELAEGEAPEPIAPEPTRCNTPIECAGGEAKGDPPD